VLARNYRSRQGEIDIVAMDGPVLAFVEVRTKRSDRFGSALFSVDAAKRKQIRRVADDYLYRNRIRDRDCRFDVVAVDVRDGEPRVALIRNAF
jgi:putative endonuclease